MKVFVTFFFYSLFSFSLLQAMDLGSQETAVASQGSGGDTQPYVAAASPDTVVDDEPGYRLREWLGCDESGWTAEMGSIEASLLPVLHSPLLVWSGIVQTLELALPESRLRRERLIRMTDPTGDVTAILAARSGSPCAFEARLGKAAATAVATWEESVRASMARVERHISSLESSGPDFLLEVDDGADLVLACKQIAYGFWQRLGADVWRTLVAEFRAETGEVFDRFKVLASTKK